MATLMDYARMCNVAYLDEKDETFRPDKIILKNLGFSILLTSKNPNTGFAGCCFFSATEYIVAYSGTDPKEKKDIENDLILISHMGSQYKDAHALYEAARQFRLHNQHLNKPLTVCGHSLGGALAQCTGYNYGAGFVTFNAPHAFNAIQATRNYEFKEAKIDLFKPSKQEMSEHAKEEKLQREDFRKLLNVKGLTFDKPKNEKTEIKKSWANDMLQEARGFNYYVEYDPIHLVPPFYQHYPPKLEKLPNYWITTKETLDPKALLGDAAHGLKAVKRALELPNGGLNNWGNLDPFSTIPQFANVDRHRRAQVFNGKIL
jgi:hypothetical protein